MADALSKVFEDGTVGAQEVSFEVKPGRVLALLGKNGAGKTTTMHMTLGLLSTTSGRSLIDGIDVQARPLDAYRRVGYVSENVLLYGNLTAYENLRFFGRIGGSTVPHAHLLDLLRRVGLHEDRDRRVRTFSKGMRQRLGLAIALVKDPPALVLDEPTTGLDPEGAEALLALVRALREEGRAVLLSTHDLDRVPEVADDVGVIARGRLVDVVAAPRHAADVRALYVRLSGGAT